MNMALIPLLDQLWQQLHRTSLLNSFFLVSIVLIFFLAHSLKLTIGSKLNLPPSPPKLPIIGNLHQLGTLPHRSLQALSNKYGPLMLLHLGQAPTLVISSAEMAREIMKTHDIVFSNRPKTTATNIFLYGCVDIAFSLYGEYWKQIKRISVTELLSLKRVNSFQLVREEEVAASIDRIRYACLTGTFVNLSDMLQELSSNIVCRCVIGRKAEEDGKRELAKLTRKVMVQFKEFSFGDMFPYLSWVDVLTGFVARLKATSRALNIFLHQVIEEHKLSKESGDELSEKKDFVHILLQLQSSGLLDIQLTQDNIKAILLDMFFAGTEITSTVLEWAMAELMKNPNVKRKAQEEVRRVVGKKSKLEVNDINHMTYLKCIIKETLRLHPPLLVARETSASVKLGGYDIPPKTTVLVNALSIQTDPRFWDRPQEFLPERFENNSIDYKGQDFQFIPFGGGRRQCPGMTFGIVSAEYIIANLLYWFDWRLPNGGVEENLDMNETYGLAVHKKVPLHLVPILYSP